MVQAWAPRLAKPGVTINAVAPGFIETQMTAAMPIADARGGPADEQPVAGRAAGRRRRDDRVVREPGSAGVTGNIVRVCGQSLIGA